MKNTHFLRPLYVVLAIVFLFLAARPFVVPKDFGSHEAGYMYGWHRKGNEAEWKAFPVKFRTREYCKDCHEDKLTAIAKSPHRIIECENCHGLAGGHPESPPKLGVDRSRGLCLRCHGLLPYETTGRSAIRGIEPDSHNPEAECSSCHDPHNPKSGGVS